MRFVLICIVVLMNLEVVVGKKPKQTNSDTLSAESFVTSSYSVRQRLASLNLTSNIKRFIEHEEVRLQVLKNFSGHEEEVPFVKQRIKEFKIIHKSLVKNSTASKFHESLRSNHPTTVLAAVRNFLAAWENKLANTTVYGKRLREFLEANDTKPFPKRRDLSTIGKSLSIIQATYNLSTSDLRKGQVLGVKGEPVNRADCYDIGKTVFQVGLLNVAQDWLEAAIRGYDLDKLNASEVTFNMSDALASIAKIAFKKKDKNKALKYFEKASELDPDNLFLYQEFMKHRFGRDVQVIPEVDLTKSEPWRKKFYEMCLNSTNATFMAKQKLLLPQLKCRLRSSKSIPYLVYKEEILSKSPYISVIYQFIGKNQTKTLKNATVHLLRETVLPGFDAHEVWHCKSGYFLDSHHESIGNLSIRVGELTGLDTEQESEVNFIGEPVQVLDFGVAGLVLPHNELKMRYSDRYFGRSRGNRFATLHVYLSNVTAGGATVFIEQNITVIPKEGMAVLWYNYKPSGEPETKLLSSTCPLAVGENVVLEKGLWLPRDNPSSFCGRSSKSTFSTSDRIQAHHPALRT